MGAHGGLGGGGVTGADGIEHGVQLSFAGAAVIGSLRDAIKGQLHLCVQSFDEGTEHRVTACGREQAVEVQVGFGISRAITRLNGFVLLGQRGF